MTGYAENALDVVLGVSLATTNYANNLANTPINPELQLCNRKIESEPFRLHFCIAFNGFMIYDNIIIGDSHEKLPWLFQVVCGMAGNLILDTFPLSRSLVCQIDSVVLFSSKITSVSLARSKQEVKKALFYQVWRPFHGRDDFIDLYATDSTS